MHKNTHAPALVTPSVVSVHDQTLVVIINVAILSGEQHQAVFDRIYSRLSYHYGVDLTAFPRSEGDSLLVVAERFDVIDKVYALAVAEYQYLQFFEN